MGSQMEIERCSEGMQSHEERIIQKIEEAFTTFSGALPVPATSGSLQDQLKTIGANSMFPWKGYAGHTLVGNQGREGEFDLLIVTHRIVIIVELKHWNSGAIISTKDQWFVDDRHMGRSAVKVTKDKMQLMHDILKPLKNKFTNKGYCPFIDYLVVMTGSVTFEKLIGVEEKHTVTLDQFLQLADEKEFDKRFPPRNNHPKVKMLNRDFHVFDEVFRGEGVVPKKPSINGFKADELIFTHPREAYKENIAKSLLDDSDPALIRSWNFENIEGTQSATPSGRLGIVSREQVILKHIKRQDGSLYNNCLRPLTTPQKNDITSQYYELFELPSQHMTFNQYIGRFGKTIGAIEKLNLVKVLISRFSDLHNINVAHLDIGGHSLWLSTEKYGVALSNFISATQKSDGEIGYYKNSIAVDELALSSSPKNLGSSTAFEEDVRTLAVVSWHVFNGERLSENSISSLYAELLASDAWYAPILINALDGGTYSSASDFFDAIESLQPSDEKAYDFDDTDLKKYRKNIRHSIEYRYDKSIVDIDGKQVYLSGEQVVTAWDDISLSGEGFGYKILNFLQKIEKLSSVSPNYIPKIKNFGIASKSSSLFVVTDSTEGVCWGELELAEHVCLDVINQFIVAVEHLHEIGLTHGGLRPENITVLHTQNETNITSIGIPEFSLPNAEIVNRAYIPEKISDFTLEELDNYAVMHMSLELLNKSNHVSGISYSALSKAVEAEYADRSFSFKSLTRFKQSFEMSSTEKIAPVSIILKGNFERVVIYPDNGKIYVKIEKSKDNESNLKVRLTGIGGHIFLIYRPSDQTFISGSPPILEEFLNSRDIKNSQLYIDFPLEINSHSHTDFSLLQRKLRHNEPFQRAINTYIKNVSNVVPYNVMSKSEQVVPHNELLNLVGEVEIEKASLTNSTDLSLTSPNIEVDSHVANLFEDSLKHLEITKGSVVTGVVTAIDSEIVTIQVGLESEGEVSRSEFLNSAGELEVAVGDEVSVNVHEIEDDLDASQVSRQRAVEIKRWHQLEKIQTNDETITGVITDRVKGGFNIDLGGIQAFLPGSLIDSRPLQDVSHLEGVDLEFKILKLDMLRNNVVVSRRALMDEAAKGQRVQVLSTLEEGAVVKGFVKNFTDYGAFVDLGGFDGLLHIDDIAWHHIKHPTEILIAGADIEVKVLKVDTKKERVSLGLKQLQNNPSTIFPTSDSLANSLTTKLTDGEKVLSLEEIKRTEVLGDPIVVRDDFQITTKKLWRAMLETELESHPYIEIVDQPLPSNDGSGDLVIQYDSDKNPLSKFKKTDDVELIQKKGKSEMFLGKVDLSKSIANYVHITKTQTHAENLSDQNVVYFRTNLEGKIGERRKSAIERLLKGAGLIGNLVDYFDPTCELESVKYDITVSDQDFSQYDNHDKKTSFNKHQRDAFIKLLQNGPLSLLQGPPGTGKTEFIAAFVHFLLSKQGVQKILLVSTTHEAVNNAAERIRTHFARSDSELGLVRFSSDQDKVSPGLKDVYSEFLVSEKREMFRAEVKYRVSALATAYGVQAKYLEEIVDAELKVFHLVDQYCADIANISKLAPDSEDLPLIKKLSAEVAINIREILANQFEIHLDPDEDVSHVKNKVIDNLNKKYSIRPDECIKARALAKISSDMLGVLATGSEKYDEFFARSKQLITGTCVGIGKHSIGMKDNQYDWVIIDEAALSSTSDLAIAMQSGTRILLVGDHKQLSAEFSQKQQIAVARNLGISESNDGFDSILECDFAKVFESPYGIQSSASLLTQYRMAPAIGRLVSENFYEGTLENGERIVPEFYSAGPQFLNSFVTWVDTSDLDEKSYHKTKHGSTSLYNTCEADLIIKMLKGIYADQLLVDSLKNLVSEDEAAIGVLCMYQDQRAHIMKLFNEEVWSDEFIALVKIGTVDSYQGKENRIIILSVTNSSSSKKPRFLKIPNRINVALSRAMDRLIVVGSVAMWKGQNESLPFGRVVSFMLSADSEKQYRFLSPDVVNEIKEVKV